MFDCLRRHYAVILAVSRDHLRRHACLSLVRNIVVPTHLRWPSSRVRRSNHGFAVISRVWLRLLWYVTSSADVFRPAYI
jgi:hypothetical protein